MSLGTARNLYLVRINPSGWLAAENTSLIEGHSMKFLLRRRFLYAAVLLCLGTWSSQRTVALMNGDGDPDATHRRALRAGIAETVVIPGPLPSFLRMAGISQEVSPDDVVPLLARNVALYGYNNGRPTEYLVLLNRYVHFARDLRSLAESDDAIRVGGCDSAGKLDRVLGYKPQGICGHRGFALMTADPERAFLTIDSGFPLTGLERALQKSDPFNFAFQLPAFQSYSLKKSGSASRQRKSSAARILLMRSYTIRRWIASTGRWRNAMEKQGPLCKKRRDCESCSPLPRPSNSMEAAFAFTRAMSRSPQVP